MVHEIKTINEFFEPVIAGLKRFHVCKNDRDFKNGDKLFFCEYDGINYTGRNVLVEVDYILYGGHFGLVSGACIMSFKIIGKNLSILEANNQK